MGKKKVDVMEIAKFTSILIIFTMIILCQFNKEGDDFKPIEVPRQMWTLVGLIVTNLFMGRMVMIKATRSSVWIKGIVLVLLMLMVCASIYWEITIGKEIWGIVGGVIAFVFKSEIEED